MLISDWISDVCSSDLVASASASFHVEYSLLYRRSSAARAPRVSIQLTGRLSNSGSSRSKRASAARSFDVSSLTPREARSEERRVGKERVGRWSAWWCLVLSKKSRHNNAQVPLE